MYSIDGNKSKLDTNEEVIFEQNDRSVEKMQTESERQKIV